MKFDILPRDGCYVLLQLHIESITAHSPGGFLAPFRSSFASPPGKARHWPPDMGNDPDIESAITVDATKC